MFWREGRKLLAISEVMMISFSPVIFLYEKRATCYEIYT